MTSVTERRRSGLAVWRSRLRRRSKDRHCAKVTIEDAQSPQLLVRPEAALAQIEAETVPTPPAVGHGSAGTTGTTGDSADAGTVSEGTGKPEEPQPAQPRRFHGSVPLDATRTGRDASKIADEVIAHLASLVGSKVRVTLEIEADIPDGVPENVVRTVTENCRTLKFGSHGFEVV